MKKTMDLLANLQEVDLKIFRYEHSKKDFPLQCENLKKEIEEEKGKCENLKNMLDEAEAEKTEKEKEVDVLKEHLAKSQERLNVITTNKEYDAIHTEIEVHQNKIKSNEDRIISLIERIEELTKEYEEAEQNLKAIEEKNQPEIERLEKEILEIDQNIGSAAEMRENVKKDIPVRELRNYERILNGRKNGMVISTIGQNSKFCSFCHKTLSLQQVNEVRRKDKLITCENCGSILHWQEEGGCMKKIEKSGLTFDDVLILPAYSGFLPRDTNIKTKLTKNIQLNIPFVSAAMDTVTESKLSIAIAREGGLGFIHKNMPPDVQAAEVSYVKRSENIIIDNPFSLSPELAVSDAIKLMKEKNISGVPITENGKLVGILTSRDLRFQKDESVSIASIMTPRERLVTAKENITMEEAEVLLHKHRIEKLPVVGRNNKLVGLITVKDIQIRAMFPNACKDKSGHLRVGAAVGVGKDTMERVDELVRAKVDVIAIDTAHGHSKGVLSVTKKVKSKYPNLNVVAGNVATYQAFMALAKAGADCVKVGIGPGSICTTRIISGAGVPQITAIMDCARAAQKAKIPLIADGGIKFSGDVVKAIASGADVVMVGNLLAGTEEAPGETILYEGRTFKAYRGMGSLAAMKKGSKDRYFQDDLEEESKFVPEGIEGRVPFKGPVSSIIYQLVGGLRVGMGYSGNKTIKDLKEKAKFIQLTSSSLRENHPHDVKITREAPNYKVY